jgi:hypothetical protein
MLHTRPILNLSNLTLPCREPDANKGDLVKTGWLIVAAVAFTSASGCGTYCNVASRSLKTEAGPKAVLGGVGVDVKGLTWQAAEFTEGGESGEHLCCMTLFLVDLPLSLIGDTLTLYKTIPATLARLKSSQDQEEPQTPQKDTAGDLERWPKDAN